MDSNTLGYSWNSIGMKNHLKSSSGYKQNLSQSQSQILDSVEGVNLSKGDKIKLKDIIDMRSDRGIEINDGDIGIVIGFKTIYNFGVRHKLSDEIPSTTEVIFRIDKCPGEMFSIELSSVEPVLTCKKRKLKLD